MNAETPSEKFGIRLLDCFVVLYVFLYIVPIPFLHYFGEEIFENVFGTTTFFATIAFLGVLVLLRIAGAAFLPGMVGGVRPTQIGKPTITGGLKVLSMVATFGAITIAANHFTGAIGSREGLDFQNFNVTSEDSIRTQLPNLLMVVGAFCWGRYLTKSKLLWGVLGAGVSGLVLGLSATRWQLLLSLSPVVLVVMARLSIWKVILGLFLVYAVSIPFAFMRSENSAMGGSYYGMLLNDVPFVESAYAVETIGEHPEGLQSFLAGFIEYPIPRFLFNKGIDVASAEFNSERAGLNIMEDSGNVLPGIIGSLYMYGGFTFVLGGAFIIGGLLVIMGFKTGAPRGFSEIWIMSLGFLGVLLQIRNISFGYIVPWGMACLFKLFGNRVWGRSR